MNKVVLRAWWLIALVYVLVLVGVGFVLAVLL